MRLKKKNANLNTENSLNSNININEVNKAINKFKNNKSPGYDMIQNEVLKNISIRTLICKVLNLCFLSGIVPSLWLKGVIVPIPKGSNKDPNVPLNYRGICLLSCFAKLYSSVLNMRITTFCEEEDILVDEQNGFRKDRSCIDHIFSLSTIVTNSLNESKSVYCSFIDLEKAFDWVEGDFIFYRLLSYGIQGKIYKAVTSLYQNTSCCLKINNYLTPWFYTNTGVKQGDNLSPTLFSLFLNDLAVNIKNLNGGISIGNIKVSILLYADDLVLVSENEEELQNMLNILYKWCLKWQVKVNIEKSKIVHFRKQKRKLTEFKFYLGKNELEIVHKYKYLGEIFDENLTFKDCINLLANSSS